MEIGSNDDARDLRNIHQANYPLLHRIEDDDIAIGLRIGIRIKLRVDLLLAVWTRTGMGNEEQMCLRIEGLKIEMIKGQGQARRERSLGRAKFIRHGARQRNIFDQPQPRRWW